MANKVQNEWLVIVPDAEGKLEERMRVRATHIDNVKKHVDSGFFQMGGAMLRAQPQEQELDISGSIVVARAATAEEVLTVLKEDIYARTGVWDLKNVQVYPFKCVYRKALE
ncbi:Xenovulene A biosynthesis cluster protein asL2 like [Verticillium longisporum]|uniref:Xenovulene A biosynthesis cluster protein asL2 like n=1 Tax=Verticillium longisporum TaxID=100787 RepID=A0A8I2ZMA6_VERLO|nr:Xenovulene A biosynthesis cluster protein asL2 like [Verticillium longisporum]